MPNWDLRAGDRVLLRRLPTDFAELPEEAMDILDLCLGREFEILGLDATGRVEIDVSRVTRRELGSSRPSIFVEAECLELLDR